MKQTQWWKNSVVYQIYPRSFQDSNGDGIGDLPGIIQRLDYLQKLGVDVIWLSPVYQSPQDDNGYDISDYYMIAPMFGTMEDMDTLLAEAKKRGIRIVMDLVANHSSDEHVWFIESRNGNPKYRDYYVWREGTKEVPPNDLRAAFGGSAWEWDENRGAWYFHQFSRKQPDLNWENPAMRQDIYRMIRWWLDKGLGGFRLDVIELIGKIPDRKITANGPMLHPYIREMTEQSFGKYDIMTVGETWNADPDAVRLYSNPDGLELSMVFQFEHICASFTEDGKWRQEKKDFRRIKQIFTRWQEALYQQGWNTLFWDNHDLPRAVSNFGDDAAYREQSAKALALYLHGMQGTPYIYQGEELGMTNYRITSPEEIRDIEAAGMYREFGEKGWSSETRMDAISRYGRDNARTPMQWDDTEQAGFTDATPWMPVNPNYHTINASEELAREDSVFHWYRQLIELRRKSEWADVLRDGKYHAFLDEDEDLFGYTRTLGGRTLLFMGNFHPVTRRLGPEALPEDIWQGLVNKPQILMSNQPPSEEGRVLREKQNLIIRPFEAFAAVL